MTDAGAGGQTKEFWRAWAKERRTGTDWDSTSHAIRASLLGWEPLATARTVLIYLPMQGEVNIQPLIESELGCRWLTTRTPRSGRMLTIHELGGPLEVHPYGYLQPHESAPEVHPFDVDVFLVPGLVFDLWGNRLGWGAGYYDRLLAMAAPGARIVGIVPTDLVVDLLPTDTHDVPMTHLATEEGVVETARTA